MRGATLLLLATLVAACGRTSAPPDASPKPGPSASAASVGPRASAGAERTPAFVGEGCQADAPESGPSAARLERVAELCMPGAARLGEIARLELAAQQPGELRLAVSDTERCLRIAAVAEDPSVDLALTVLDGAGRTLGSDELPGAVALVGSQGPLCLREPGSITLRLSAARPTAVSVAGWQ